MKKLIAQTTRDLAEADKKRKEEFKRYEMEKEYQKLDKLNHTNGEEKEKLEKEFKVKIYNKVVLMFMDSFETSMFDILPSMPGLANINVSLRCPITSM